MIFSCSFSAINLLNNEVVLFLSSNSPNIEFQSNNFFFCLEKSEHIGQ